MSYHNPEDLGKDAEKAKAFVAVGNASQASVNAIINADENSEDGRSQWLWVRFPNGDLMLATFPQGDTYFVTETDHTV